MLCEMLPGLQQRADTQGGLLGFGGLGSFFPDKARRLGVEQLVPEAAADQVRSLGQVEHAALTRHGDAAGLYATKQHSQYRWPECSVWAKGHPRKEDTGCSKHSL